MAIERLHLQEPERLEYGESPFMLASQLMLRHRNDFEPMEPGVYDLTPENTGYDEMEYRCRLTVLSNGTGFQEPILTPSSTAITRDPHRGVLPQDVLSLPADVESMGVLAYYRPSKLYGQGALHMFDVIKWRNEDPVQHRARRRLPGVSIILATEITVEDLQRTGLF